MRINRSGLPEGSPLLVHSSALAKRIGEALQPRWNAAVALGMSYGSPSIPQALDELRTAGCTAHRRAAPVSAVLRNHDGISVRSRHLASCSVWRWVPELRFIGSYHDDERLYRRAREPASSSTGARTRRTICCSPFMAFPRATVTAGDPYYCQSMKTARLVAEAPVAGREEIGA